MDTILKSAISAAKRYRPGYEITGCLNYEGYYAFSLKPKATNNIECDAIVCINKKTFEEEPVNPMGNPTLFTQGTPVWII